MNVGLAQLTVIDDGPTTVLTCRGALGTEGIATGDDANPSDAKMPLSETISNV
jgi:hypothetical protein